MERVIKEKGKRRENKNRGEDSCRVKVTEPKVKGNWGKRDRYQLEHNNINRRYWERGRGSPLQIFSCQSHRGLENKRQRAGKNAFVNWNIELVTTCNRLAAVLVIGRVSTRNLPAARQHNNLVLSFLLKLSGTILEKVFLDDNLFGLTLNYRLSLEQPGRFSA